MIELDTRAGRTHHRLQVTEAKSKRANARHQLGTSRKDAPNVAELLRAAADIAALLYDATRGEAGLAVMIKPHALEENNLGSLPHAPVIHPNVLLSTLRDREASTA